VRPSRETALILFLIFLVFVMILIAVTSLLD
jgi:hypothetical protein